MNAPDSHEELEHLSQLLRSGADAGFDEPRRRLLRASFLERAEAEMRTRERRLWRPLWALPAVATLVALVVWGVWPRALDFEVEGAPRDGAYVRAPSDRPVTVRFSDETTLRAAPGSRLRIEEAGAREARVLVERGHTEVHVVHAALRDWTFVAGPFQVLVTGTRFALDWDPTAETFELSLHEGSVEVRGPGTGPVAVRAGQRFRGDVQQKSVLVSQAQPSAVAPAAQTPPEPAPPSSATSEPAAPALAQPESRTARPATQSAPTWQERITRGDFATIVAEAERRGVPQCLASCSAGDLRALSDAARYTGKSAIAEQSLVALRQRFGSGAGRDAAFLLGRLSEQQGAFSNAERWYDTYLRESPGGAFAAEALAGKMRVVKKLRGASAAAPLARDYLKRFPKGVHGATAREILGLD